jgi:diguanylate cyclase
MAVESDAPLFDRIRDFLLDQRLSPDPRHYHFAHRMMTERDGALARSVRTLVDGGFRLSARDIEALGGEAVAALPTVIRPRPLADAAEHPATDDAPYAATRVEALVADTHRQVEGFADMVQAFCAETEGFGRDLAASADAIRCAHGGTDMDEVVRLTSVMLARVHVAESRLADATSEACALRAELAQAHDNARRDSLTDLPNRRAFEEAFAAVAADRPVHVAVCDVDRFKSVNDRFGHAVGDRVLKAIGGALAGACEGHLVARYGGEEFAILFVGIAREVAAATLEAARAEVAARRFRVRESNVAIGSVTFSAGMSRRAPDEDLAPVFARADALLYAAKDAGRDQLRLD